MMKVKIKPKFLQPKFLFASKSYRLSLSQRLKLCSKKISEVNLELSLNDEDTQDDYIPLEKIRQLTKSRPIMKFNESVTQNNGDKNEAKVFSVRSRACYLFFQRSKMEAKNRIKSPNISLDLDEFENLHVRKLNLPKTTCGIKTLTTSAKLTGKKLLYSEEEKAYKEGYLWKSSKNSKWRKKYCVLKNKAFIWMKSQRTKRIDGCLQFELLSENVEIIPIENSFK